MSTLRKAMADYPVAQLGDWTWILVRSEDWKGILRIRGLDPDSPAFTYYAKRQTFIDEALVMPDPVRARELLLKWNLKMSDLLDLALRHELGHALCNDVNEQSADRIAALLKQKETIGSFRVDASAGNTHPGNGHSVSADRPFCQLSALN